MRVTRQGVQAAVFVAAYAVVLVLGLVAMYAGWLTPYFTWLASLGMAGNALVALSFIPASLPFLAGYTPLTLASGYLYGVIGGALTSEIGAVLGAMVAFAATRRFARRKLAAKLGTSPQFRAFIAAVDAQGFVVIALLRCAPVPFGLQNGAFALSNVTFARYTAATIVGLVPEQLMFAYFGSTLKSLADVAAGHDALTPAQSYALYAQLAFAIVIFVVVARIGRRALRYAHVDKIEDIQLEFSDAELGAASSGPRMPSSAVRRHRPEDEEPLLAPSLHNHHAPTAAAASAVDHDELSNPLLVSPATAAPGQDSKNERAAGSKARRSRRGRSSTPIAAAAAAAASTVSSLLSKKGNID
ncbi:SNARE associated Golgi protein [Thecamonas trahens ATCC 50062]|uniref:SNARE associated Golgi protein n=1 Tax=Thecamonas trahens ATCC 50062 TaxID=461836 RepID=A0A0L0DQA7_THETB|nr:SNARE associated Golgi protein [Thecamonas trahens ATCC 50062]KNC54487.1 SNARE associated Golgi protein [Thecamonas trahens ATCC 50062]|eukprot:XP_013753641.1 SNARE associated Golgi protein [Thecamonas trahens ATCC 50062]